MRGKNDVVDAERIAEYVYRFQDKSVLYQLPDKAFASFQILLTDRELVLADRQKYEALLKDQKAYMDQADYQKKSNRLGKLLVCLKAQITSIDEEIASVVAFNSVISHQVELLKTIDGIGEKVAVRMVALTGGDFQSSRMPGNLIVTPDWLHSSTPLGKVYIQEQEFLKERIKI